MTDEAEFDLKKKFSDFEMRQYKSVLMATVRGYSDNDSFRLLFDYISGHNKTRKKIAMTAPVVTSEKIPMTTPVVTGTGSFSFVMPSNYDPSTIPEPLDDRVTIEEMPERLVAVMRFRGSTKPKKVQAKADELRKSMELNSIVPLGEPFLMRYNPPFTPGFLRRNEVGIEAQE